MLDRVIFGDNQFFGINHMSEAKAQSLDERFRNLNAITDVIDIAYECGIRGFMLNTNDRSIEICDYLRKNSSRYPDLAMYPSMPYAHKYAAAVAEKGIFGALKDSILAGSSAAEIGKMVAKGGRSLFEQDMIKVMQLMIDVEMKMFRGLNVKVVFLQNIVTDLLLGYGVKDIFIGFAEYIRERYKAEPGFTTMNMPMTVEFLLDCGIENPVVCSSINKAGYFMNPSMKAYEKAIKDKKFRPIAMSILASGAVPAPEAVEYICKQPQIESIVFGASSRGHIAETKNLIDNYSQ
ncbi:MAG: hypothetical protein QGH93_00015 [Gammaproteobacteria bacterium]|jgi:hypothetical protein|nr:hypothetical protein [Chromatiales bacterium]MDP6673223.1 hypothetical protein [Gammaproteobacteria bacterium]